MKKNMKKRFTAIKTGKNNRKTLEIISGVISIIFVIVVVLCLVNLKSKNDKLEAELKELKTQISVSTEEEIEKELLTLKCADKTMVFGETNGIKKANIAAFKVETTYPIVLYQVVGEDGKILQNDFNEYTGTAKQNSFSLADVTEEVTEIRLSGFDIEGNQIESRDYKIVFLDKETIETKE